jgi:hypothetical protein
MLEDFSLCLKKLPLSIHLIHITETATLIISFYSFIVLAAQEDSHCVMFGFLLWG